MTAPLFVTEPKIYLVGSSRRCHIGMAEFLVDQGIEEKDTYEMICGQEPTENKVGDYHSDQEAICEMGGRVCYMSFKPENKRPGSRPAYFKNIIESGHGSVLEHVTWNFILTGISRTLSHELVRHRQGCNFSQLSQRYVNHANDICFVVPYNLCGCDQAFTEFTGSCVKALESYKNIQTCLLKNKLATDFPKQLFHHHDTDVLFKQLVTDPKQRTEILKSVRQEARAVLPGCTETKMLFTANARALRHIIELRTSRHADVEIRRLFFMIWNTVRVQAPNLFGDYMVNQLPDGTYSLETHNRKV